VKILLTGATGFVGQNLLSSLVKKTKHFFYDEDLLLENNLLINVLGRKNIPIHKNVKFFYCSDINENITYSLALKTVDVVIHCAARVHIMADDSNNPLDEYRKVNTEGTLNLARQASEAGVKRFIFISTIKVNGEETVLGKPFKPMDSEHLKIFMDNQNQKQKNSC